MIENSTIVLKNISKLNNAQSGILEKRFAHLSELVDILYNEAGTDEIFFRDKNFIELYKQLMGKSRTVVSEASESFNKVKLEYAVKILSAAERAYICRKITDEMGIKGVISVGTYFDFFDKNENETVSCVQNDYSDKAYTQFAGILHSSKVKFRSNYEKICEDVYFNKSMYCIIPIEDSTDGKLWGLSKLIEKYELKILMITKVFNNGGWTFFALVAKNISIPLLCNGKKHIQISLKAEEAILPVIIAADLNNLKVVSVESSDDAESMLNMDLSVCDEGICGFFTFLFLEYDQFILKNFYGELIADSNENKSLDYI